MQKALEYPGGISLQAEVENDLAHIFRTRIYNSKAGLRLREPPSSVPGPLKSLRFSRCSLSARRTRGWPMRFPFASCTGASPCPGSGSCHAGARRASCSRQHRRRGCRLRYETDQTAMSSTMLSAVFERGGRRPEQGGRGHQFHNTSDLIAHLLQRPASPPSVIARAAANQLHRPPPRPAVLDSEQLGQVSSSSDLVMEPSLTGSIGLAISKSAATLRTAEASKASLFSVFASSAAITPPPLRRELSNPNVPAAVSNALGWAADK